jgi:uncharacterized membrane protein
VSIHDAASFAFALIAFAALDFVWLGVLMRRFYRQQLSAVARMKQGRLAPIWPVAGLVYVILALAIVAFAVPRAAGAPLAGAMWGGILGFVLYGFYNLTNYATLAAWSPAMTLVDTVWGSAVCSAVATIVTTFAGRTS